MENTLSMWSGYLQQVEEKLIELLQSPTDSDPEERAAKVGEALKLVRGAQKELSAAQANIELIDDSSISLRVAGQTRYALCWAFPRIASGRGH